MPPVSGYQAAPFVMPFSNEGDAVLQATPRDILPWLFAYISDRCLNTSSSGVNDGCDRSKPRELYRPWPPSQVPSFDAAYPSGLSEGSMWMRVLSSSHLMYGSDP
uniref:Uncharacterized protein n=2 Tax=Pyretophorus TaxID=44537 RepID=A0A182IHE8_ANOAR